MSTKMYANGIRTHACTNQMLALIEPRRVHWCLLF